MAYLVLSLDVDGEGGCKFMFWDLVVGIGS